MYATISVGVPGGYKLGGLELDLEGDTLGGCPIWGDGLENVYVMRCKAERVGTWNLWVKAVTIEGCRGETGVRRPVNVIRTESALRCGPVWAGGSSPGPESDTNVVCREAVR